MEYTLTIYNKDSPDYMISLYHAQIGTATIRCKNGDIVLSLLDRYRNTYLNVDRIDIRGVGKATWFWYRNSDNTHLLDLK